MTEAYVVGVGQTAFGAFPDESYRSLFETAFDRAATDAGDAFDPEAIDEAVVGTLGVGGRQLGLSGPAVVEHVGLDVPTTRVENACAAGGYAVRNAVQAVKSGMADVVLAGGYEVMTDLSGDAAKYWLGVSGETEWERLAGTTFAGVYAQMARSYLDAYDADVDHLSMAAVKNHANAALNEKAHLSFECSLDQASSGTPVADPLTLYHCCPTSDGAAAVLVASEEYAAQFDDAVRIAGVGAGTDRVGLADRDTYTGVPAARDAAERAYDMAGLGPDDVDVAEVHDCFAIAELMAYEDLGFCDRGDAPDLLEAGVTERDGDLPVNASGGLKAKGHPIGATGAGQLCELVTQLRGEAGDRQVASPNVGLAHNVGGSGGAAVVTVLEGPQ